MISHSTTSKPGDLAREVGQRCRERRLLVEAGDLDDELHARAGRGATGRAERSTPYTRWRPVSHMASATITRPAPGPDPAAGRRSRRSVVARAGARRARAGHAGRVPASTRPIPNYDSYYSLLWGRELLHGVKPTFDGYRTPTEHPLAVAFGALLSLAGRPRRPRHGRRHAGVVRRARRRALPPGARRRSGRSSGWPPPPCCARASTSRSWPRAAYIDIPYLAFVVWAAALEAERPRRGTVGVRAAGLRGAHAPGGVAAERPVLAVVHSCPPTWPQRVTLRGRSTGAPPGRSGRAGLVGDRRPDVLADPHQRPGRGARAHQRRAVRRSQHDA